MMTVREIEDNIYSTTDSDNPSIMTASGQRLSLLNPQPQEILLQDVCHHLSHLCRFTGATKRFYSVAQHLTLATGIAQQILNRDAAVDRESEEYFDQLLAVALHDAEEYAVNDLASPLKAAIGPSKYRWVANNMRRVIYEKYGVDWAYHNQLVKQADLNALMVERHYLLPKHGYWGVVSRDKLPVAGIPAISVREARDGLHNLIKGLITKRNLARAND